MDNPFEHIDKPLKPVPEELKAKVMSDVATAKLLMELASLFSVDVVKIIETTISKRKK
ncbi:hypothetical protein RM697_08850 [Ichthyenterobacterium sp. W332]|uniref:Transposase n=1 Tax=Microcosmobacter mediterraneus TaxID=3075607 RepID=A0ABU2YKS5_9FLAO|nr:hypothetical protein [Ichthyenterobacterium sp. W332]MDT0558754.1 hypothetical protein [Ichthyenterobacterium sp. W332]